LPRSPHGPARLGTYLQVHENRLAQLRASGFLGEDTLTITPRPGGGFAMRGELACTGGLVVAVHKRLVVLAGEGMAARVQTVRYSYNATVRGRGNVLRYDNVGEHGTHPDRHHRHDFDFRTDRELPGSPSWVGAAGWPTLGTFLEYVERWYIENRDELPGTYPPLGVEFR